MGCVGEEVLEGYSTTDHIFTLQAMINTCLNKIRNFSMLSMTTEKHLILLTDVLFGLSLLL